MPRGRQFYDPIIQAPSKVESASSRRIELYPEQDIRDNAVTLRWVGRLVSDDGVIIEKAQGSFDHDDALRQAQELWPGLEVFELREESEDSTWDGMGPSPRLWQGARISASEQPDYITHEPVTIALSKDMPTDLPPGVRTEKEETVASLVEAMRQVPNGPRALRTFVAAEPGAYCHIDDIVLVLEDYAQQYDEQGNPSGALALREAAAALREPF